MAAKVDKVISLMRDNGNLGLWFTVKQLRKVGGADATRRVRQMRGYGYGIEKRRTSTGDFEYRSV